VFAFRRVPRDVLEGLELARVKSRRGPEPGPFAPLTSRTAPPASAFAPTVVWTGAAARRPELRRFCEYLERTQRLAGQVAAGR
jgi:hypothetical protein